MLACTSCLGVHLFDGQWILADILDLLQHALDGLQHKFAGIPVEDEYADRQNCADEQRAQHVEERIELAIPLHVQHCHRLVAGRPVSPIAVIG